MCEGGTPQFAAHARTACVVGDVVMVVTNTMGWCAETWRRA